MHSISINMVHVNLAVLEVQYGIAIRMRVRNFGGFCMCNLVVAHVDHQTTKFFSSISYRVYDFTGLSFPIYL